MRYIVLIVVIIIFSGCRVFQKSAEKYKPYNFGWYPKSYSELYDNFKKYSVHFGCRQGETIASIGAGNGRVEVEISCEVNDISWYLEEIDSMRFYEFDKVLHYHEKLKGTPIDATFNLVMGNEKSTNLPKGIFDRILMINVFHEIENRTEIMHEIHELLKPKGELVIMERMADKPGQMHGDCDFPKLYEPDFLEELQYYGFLLVADTTGEKVSNLKYYTLKSSR